MPPRKYPALCLSAAVFSLTPLPSFAQTPSELDEVVVSANRVQEAKREISSNVTIITSEDIKASTATSVADLMVQHGFHVATTGDTSSVQIRGMGNLMMPSEPENQVLILLNGRRVGMSNLALAGLANVERVEIIRGPSAVQYGSSAMGGVVNIITKRGDTALKPFASVEVGIGRNSLKRETVAFGGAVNGFDFSFGGIHYSRNDVTTKGGRRWYHTAVDRDLTYNLDLGYSFNKNHRIGINYYQGEIKSEQMDNAITYSGGIRPYDGNTSDGPYTDYLKRNKNTALSYTGSTKDLDWMLSYSFGRNTRKNIDPEMEVVNYGNTLDTKAFNAQLNYHASLFTLSGGVDQYKYDTSGFTYYPPWTPYSDDPKTTMKDTGAYLTGKLRLFDEKLVFSLGLRHDRYENSGDVMNSEKNHHTGGSVGVSYHPVKWLKLRANYADGFKLPSPQQVGGDGQYNYMSNPSLKPEQNKTWEFGTDIDWNNLNASLTYFHSDWKNKIIGMDAPGTTCSSPYAMGGCSQFQNLRGAEIAGVEGSVGWDIGKTFKQSYSLKPYVSFTWLTTRKNEDKAPERVVFYNGSYNTTLPNTPKWMASYGINYAHPGLKLKSRLNANYYGKTYTKDWSDPKAYSFPYEAPYIERPSGTVVNWSLEKELVDFGKQFGKMTLRTEINNLFDGANEMYWNYPEQGRSFYVGLRYDF